MSHLPMNRLPMSRYPFLTRFVGVGAIWISMAFMATGGQTPAHDVFNPHPDLSLTADGQWRIHDPDRPLPPRATPLPESELVELATPPPDALLLFDGSALSAWQVPGLVWQMEDDRLLIRPQPPNLRTRESFGSARLHLEWRVPADVQGSGQNRGNSGVFLMGRYEVQILDSYENETYADGMAAALYGQRPPDFNALRPPGEWQYYDIWFTRPEFDEAGELVQPASITLLVNGVRVHDQAILTGPTSHRQRRLYEPHDINPLMLQNHRSPVEFRNIWIVPLD